MPPLPIVDSVSNSMVKHAYSLKVPKKAKASEDFLCEGFHLVREAFASGLHARFLLGTKNAWAQEEGMGILEKAKASKVRCFEASTKVLTYVCDTVTPQGIVGIVQKPSLPMVHGKGSLLLGIHQVQDAGNLGTLFRSAEAFGVSGIFLTEGSCDPFNPKVVRAAMGSLFRVPFSSGSTWEGVLETMKAEGYHCFGLAAGGDKKWSAAPFPRPTALWVGSEGSGLPPALLAQCESILSIPMAGQVESLNVGVAASLALFWGFTRGPLS